MLQGHGNDKYRYGQITCDFSSNVLGCIDHTGLKEHLANCLDGMRDYPSPDAAPLAQALAERLDLAADEVLVTNGATEAIYLIAQTFNRCISAILVPTFNEYRDACRIHEHTIHSIYQLTDIPPNAQLVWLCNPNNPTGTVQEKEVLTAFIEQHPDTLFVIDQSYEALTEATLLRANEAVQLPNVVLIHSMTKEYAVPGLRIGFLTAHRLLLERIGRQRMPWSVNQLAIEAGLYLLRTYYEPPFNLAELMDERAYIAQQLTALGAFEVEPSETNFLLVRLRVGKATALKEWLATEHRLLIRSCDNFEGLNDTYFRIAVQQPEENEHLLQALEEWLAM